MLRFCGDSTKEAGMEPLDVETITSNLVRFSRLQFYKPPYLANVSDFLS